MGEMGWRGQNARAVFKAEGSQKPTNRGQKGDLIAFPPVNGLDGWRCSPEVACRPHLPLASSSPPAGRSVSSLGTGMFGKFIEIFYFFGIF